MLNRLTSKQPCGGCGEPAEWQVNGEMMCSGCIRREAPLHPENASLQFVYENEVGPALVVARPKRRSRKRIADIIPPSKRLYYAGGMWTTRD